jgi:cobalt/nickel transport protein
VDPATGPLDLQPLTRPYGLTAGSAFHVEVLGADAKPVPHCAVEAERYNPTAPKAVPADEFVTLTHRTSRTGTAVVTLSDPGWWGVTAVRAEEKAEHRCTLWVHVGEQAK